MRWKIILPIALLGLALTSGLASGLQGKPGTILPLTLKDYEITTDTAILPDWRPSHVKWSLISPSGDVAYVVDSSLDSVTQVSGGIPIVGSTTWSISEDSGTMKIPAFAEPGSWRVNAKFYDRQLFIFYNQEGADIYSLRVDEGGITDNLNAPMTYVFNVPLLDSSITIAIDLILIIGFIAITIIIILIWYNIASGRKKS
jgi:hypothetical protein